MLLSHWYDLSDVGDGRIRERIFDLHVCFFFDLEDKFLDHMIFMHILQ
ncbi:MAG: hypothetical protein ACMUEL_07920 [Flavobacteriales bacterium Tduv]